MKAISAMLILCILMSGCASIYHGTADTVYMQSEQPGTSFYLDDRQVGKGTMAIVTIPKKEVRNRSLKATKEGCSEATSPLVTGFDGLTMLGCFLDYCLISVLLVDWLINGATTHVIQNRYILTPECAALGDMQGQRGAVVNAPDKAP